MLLEDEEFPSCRYSARRKGDSLSIDLSFAPDRLVGAERWYAVSDTLDFGGSDWHAEPLALSGTGRTTVTVPFPSLGYAACYVDLIYRTAGGRPYGFSDTMARNDRFPFVLGEFFSQRPLPSVCRVMAS